MGEIDDRNHAAREERVEFVVAALCFYHFELMFVLRVTSRGSSTSKVLWFLIGESNRTLAALVLAISLSQFDEGGTLGTGEDPGSGDEVHFQRWLTK